MKREKWTRQDWEMTLALVVLFFPIGVAALWRWACGLYVWYPEQWATRPAGEEERWRSMTIDDLRRKGGNADEHFDVNKRGGKWVNDWQAYVPAELRAIWRELSDEARGVAIVVGQDAADREEWD